MSNDPWPILDWWMPLLYPILTPSPVNSQSADCRILPNTVTCMSHTLLCLSLPLSQHCVCCHQIQVCVCDWTKVEQRVEPARKAAQVLHKKLLGCMQSQPGLEAEKRMVAWRLHARDAPKYMIVHRVEKKKVTCASLCRKSFHWCCCRLAWQKASKT